MICQYINDAIYQYKSWFTLTHTYTAPFPPSAKACHVIHTWVMSHIHEACHVRINHATYEWIMPNINASCHTQTHMNQAPIHPCMSKSVLCGIHTSHVTYQSMSHDTHELTWTTHQSIPQQERAMLQQASLGVSVKFSEILKSHISTADVYYRFR